MFGLLCISTTSFSLLNFSKYALKYRKPKTLNDDIKEDFLNKNSKEVSPSTTISDSPKQLSLDLKSSSSNPDEINDSQMPLNQSHATSSSYVEVSNGSREVYILLTYTIFLSFFCYGVLPGLQSYSTLPYGNFIF